jgi:hypothetical protein
MPDMLAHYEVAEAARRRLPRGPLADLLDAEHDTFKVGAQGPDFFFYSHVWPGQKSRGDLAFLCHQHKMSEAFRFMLAAAAEAPPPERRVLTAWACGYAAHLCMDAGAHPWILYWTGDITAGVDAGAGAAARRRHGVLEASIDLTLARRHPGGADAAWIRRQRLLHIPEPQRGIIAELWERLMCEVHGVRFTAAEGRAAFRDMAFVYGSMSDRGSALSRMLTALLPVIDGNGLIRTQIYPAEPHPAAASLLATARAWYYPSVPGEQHTASFHDIVETAVVETTACLQAIGAALAGGGAGSAADAGDLEAALAVIGDRNMLTGLPCEDPRPLVAFAPGLEHAWGIG